MRKPLLVCVATLLAAHSAPASAAVTFGANLEAAPASSSFFCGGPVPPFMVPSGSPTCSAYSAGIIGTGAGSLLVPATGVITRVDVRMPDATGPMRITVLRNQRLASSTQAVCCYWVGESEVFTPAAGRITSVSLRLPVRAELTPTQVYEYDALAVTALDARTPIPLAPVRGDSSGGYFPAVSRGQERFEQQTSLGENQVMIRAVWEPAAGAALFAPPAAGVGLLFGGI